MIDKSHAIAQLINQTGKYRLESENKEGANAYAFRAHHLPLNVPVFLKVIDADPSQDLFAEPRLLVEATGATEGESNLVRVYDAQTLGNEHVLMAMEWVAGGSILSKIRSGPMPLMEAIVAAIGILHGLSQLHQALLVHRDIKPANVLLSNRYGRVWPKITDFGSVARLAHIGASVAASRHSALYVPPEGWATPSAYEVRSDLYQVGLVLFEMVNGSLPYSGDAYLDREAHREIKTLSVASNGNVSEVDRQLVANRSIARAANGGGVIGFGQQQHYVPKSVMRIIKRAIAPDPSNRFGAISEMIGELEALRLPDWTPSSCGEKFFAGQWNEWDWQVEKCDKNPKIWVVKRSRAKANSFRRWHETDSLANACKKVNTFKLG